jgi:hypothetical protein
MLEANGPRSMYLELLVICLQGVEAGPPRYWYLQEGNIHYELVN